MPVSKPKDRAAVAARRRQESSSVVAETAVLFLLLALTMLASSFLSSVSRGSSVAAFGVIGVRTANKKVVNRHNDRRLQQTTTPKRFATPGDDVSEATPSTFNVVIDLPPSGSNVQWQKNVEPILSVPSKMVEIRYKIPFGLDVVPKNNLAVCTKDGVGGEKVGDVLRFATRWSMGFSPADSAGVAGTLNAFAGGGLSWQCTVFDAVAATRWEEVVEALTSNTPERTDEVVLVFERPIEEGVVAPEVQ